MIHTPEEFKILCENEEDTTYANQAASSEAWTDILNKYPQLARCVAANKTIPDDIIDRLSKSKNIDIRWKIATKRKLNKATFQRLAADADADPTIRHRIACNPKTPSDILLFLSKDPDPMVALAATRELHT